MSNEDDSLLRFLSASKPDLESGHDTTKATPVEQEENQSAVGVETAVSSHRVFWTSVAYVFLLLAGISGTHQIWYHHHPSQPSTSFGVRRHIESAKATSAYYVVPLRVADSSVSVPDLSTPGINLDTVQNKFPSHLLTISESGPVLRRSDGSRLHMPRSFDVPRFSGLQRSFDIPRFSEQDAVSFQEQYSGQALVHDGRAYLTSQLSSDDKGVVAKTHSVGRVLHSQPLQMKYGEWKHGEEAVASFHTTFVFSIENSLGDREATGDGFAFVMVPEDNPLGSAGGNLGVTNLENDQSPHTFAIEFDTWKNPSLHDRSNNHVGINLNSMVSVAAADAGYWRSISSEADQFQPLDLTSGKIQAWIDYDSISRELSVRISPVLGFRPVRPLLRECLDLSRVLKRYMSVGFSAATGDFSAKHVIHSWQFDSNRNFRHWRTSEVRRDQISTVPVFRNPHQHRRYPVDSSVTELPILSAEAEETPVMPMPMKKSCADFFRELPTMDFSSFKEQVLQRWVLVLVGFFSSFVFFHLLIVTYRSLIGCCEGFFGEPSAVAEGSEYQRVSDEEEARYILVVSEEQPEDRPLGRV